MALFQEFFQGRKIYWDTNFSIVFLPNFRGSTSLRGKLLDRGHPPTCGRKPDFGVSSKKTATNQCT